MKALNTFLKSGILNVLPMYLELSIFFPSYLSLVHARPFKKDYTNFLLHYFYLSYSILFQKILYEHILFVSTQLAYC